MGLTSGRCRCCRQRDWRLRLLYHRWLDGNISLSLGFLLFLSAQFMTVTSVYSCRPVINNNQ